MYITITGTNYYQGVDEIKIGQELLLIKDENNNKDSEAIKVLDQNKVPVGYVANSVHTVAKGCHSAGYIYRDVNSNTKCKVLFVVEELIIGEIKEK